MLTAPAVERNKAPILECLKTYYPPSFDGKILELASGTGGHCIHFAKHFTRASYQPSEQDARALHSIVAHIDHNQLINIRVPLFIDVSLPPTRWALPADFGPESIDLVFNANMIHISSNAAVAGLFRGANALLKPGGRLITYGPYKMDGEIKPESNVVFDKQLRGQNVEWGLRPVEELAEAAASNSLKLVAKHAMPANNHLLVFVKESHN